MHLSWSSTMPRRKSKAILIKRWYWEVLKYNCNPLLARVQPSCLQWQNQNQFFTSCTQIIRTALGKEEDTQYAWGRWKVMTRIKRGMLKIQNRNPVIKIYLFNKSWLLFVLELIQFLLMSMCSSLAMSPCIFFNLTLFRILVVLT